MEAVSLKGPGAQEQMRRAALCFPAAVSALILACLIAKRRFKK